MKRFLIPLLFIAALTLLPSPAQAGRYSRSHFGFSFGFSSGYRDYGYARFNYGYSRPYYRGHYGGHYAPIYRPRYYCAEPIYYPAPIVYIEPAPVVIYPRRGYYRAAPRYSRYYITERAYYYER